MARTSKKTPEFHNDKYDFPDKPSFQECYPVIEEQIQKRRGKWQLTAIAWMDYEDVAQKLRLHIWKKWYQWNPARPLAPWVNRIISNQISNLIRNNYSSFSKPCLKCPHNLGGDLCAIYETQNSECELFLKWVKGKKRAHDVKLPISIHAPQNDGQVLDYIADTTTQSSSIDFHKSFKQLSELIREELTVVEWKVYCYSYIDGLDDLEIARRMGYKTTENNRSPGYKQIKKIKNKIIVIAKKMVNEVLL